MKKKDPMLIVRLVVGGVHALLTMLSDPCGCFKVGLCEEGNVGEV